MTAIRLLAELHDAGFRVALNGDKIRAEPIRGTIPQSFLQRLTDQKPELRTLLTSPAGDTLRTLFDRAIDEGLPGAMVAGLSERDLHACNGLSRHTLAAFLRALAPRQRMAAGDVPAGWTRPVVRAGCGPCCYRWTPRMPSSPARGACTGKQAGRSHALPRGCRHGRSPSHGEHQRAHTACYQSAIDYYANR